MTELKKHDADLQDALRLRELIIDVRQSRGSTITVEAGTQTATGANLVRHGARGEEAEPVIASLIEAVQKLGVRAKTYRVVREDLPLRPLLEFRDGPDGGTSPQGQGRPQDEECDCCGQQGCRGSCEEDDVAEEGESCGCSYCPCLNETEFGETCSECQTGAHQG